MITTQERINGMEAVLLVLLAVFLIGPERLPEYAQTLREVVKAAKRHASGATEEFRATFGPELAEVDWRKLDPRQYDPRTFVRQALLEDDDARPAPSAAGSRCRTGRGSGCRSSPRGPRAAPSAAGPSQRLAAPPPRRARRCNK